MKKKHVYGLFSLIFLMACQKPAPSTISFNLLAPPTAQETDSGFTLTLNYSLRNIKLKQDRRIWIATLDTFLRADVREMIAQDTLLNGYLPTGEIVQLDTAKNINALQIHIPYLEKNAQYDIWFFVVRNQGVSTLEHDLIFYERVFSQLDASNLP
jgi:hypothetical protein